MPRRHPVPHIWLMTDERAGEALWQALARLPRGAGVVFRHYDTPVATRLALWARVRAVARQRGLVTVTAGRRLPGADGVHNPSGYVHGGIITRSAHNRRELLGAMHSGSDAVFISPVFPTRSHPDARVLGRAGLGLMVVGIDGPIVALGGMDAQRFRSVRALGVMGWAAIDAWTRQKRNAVPI